MNLDKVIQDVDVICEHKADCSIIPIRFRFLDEDGEYKTFKVKSYRIMPIKGARTTIDGVFICNNMRVIECMIEIFGVKKIVRLYYDLQKGGKWFLGIK